jgi:nucleoid DNA-binding protein
MSDAFRARNAVDPRHVSEVMRKANLGNRSLGGSMATRTKRDIVERVAELSQQPRALVRKTIQSFLDVVIEELGQNHRLEFRDFGVFEVRERGARVVHNPRTQKQVEVPAGKAVRFKAGRKMREALIHPMPSDDAKVKPVDIMTASGLLNNHKVAPKSANNSVSRSSSR